MADPSLDLSRIPWYHLNSISNLRLYEVVNLLFDGLVVQSLEWHFLLLSKIYDHVC